MTGVIWLVVVGSQSMVWASGFECEGFTASNDNIGWSLYTSICLLLIIDLIIIIVRYGSWEKTNNLTFNMSENV